MTAWDVRICPGCEAQFRSEEMFVWHCEECPEYEAWKAEQREALGGSR